MKLLSRILLYTLLITLPLHSRWKELNWYTTWPWSSQGQALQKEEASLQSSINIVPVLDDQNSNESSPILVCNNSYSTYLEKYHKAYVVGATITALIGLYGLYYYCTYKTNKQLLKEVKEYHHRKEALYNALENIIINEKDSTQRAIKLKRFIQSTFNDYLAKDYPLVYCSYLIQEILNKLKYYQNELQKRQKRLKPAEAEQLQKIFTYELEKLACLHAQLKKLLDHVHRMPGYSEEYQAYQQELERREKERRRIMAMSMNNYMFMQNMQKNNQMFINQPVYYYKPPIYIPPIIFR